MLIAAQEQKTQPILKFFFVAQEDYVLGSESALFLAACLFFTCMGDYYIKSFDIPLALCILFKRELK